MDAVTICAANYLPFAEVLGNSFLEFNKNSTFSILVVDSNKTNFVPKKEFHYLTPDDLEIEKKIFENMAFYYNVTELSTALKPSILKTLFNRGSSKILYLDPDIKVFDSFNELESILDTHEIVLTPHTLSPIPRDGLRPTELEIGASGTFNLGFVALSKSEVALQMLNWWEERLRFDAISNPSESLFTDQKWVDFVPSYFPVHVFRHPGYNVAYWNLQERKLEKIEDSFWVNGVPLKFFHFSGFRPEKPWILSKYVSDNPRIVLSENPVVIELCEKYSEASKHCGWKSEKAIAYGYENFETGEFIPNSLRRLYREDCIKASKSGETLSPPADWQKWATSRSTETGNLSRILFSLWSSRPDLKKRFPDAVGKEAKDLQQWARFHGVLEGEIDPKLLEIGNLREDHYPTLRSNEKGINVAGYLHGEFGLGQSGRLIYNTALATGLPTSPLISNRAKSRSQETVALSGIDKIFTLIIAVVNADHFQFWIDDIGKDKIKDSTIIGVWAWETEDFPKSMHHAFDFVDEIWAVSDFVKKSISRYTSKSVLTFPTPITSPSEIEKLNRENLKLKENDKYNLFIFDYMSVFERKNPIDLVRAHCLAFPDEDGPKLLIKSTNSDKDAENREKLRYFCHNRKDVILIEDYLSRGQLTALINECYSYISLHRSEGYGLTLAEAMSLGKPVIATDYSGNKDFMNSENSLLVPYELVKIGPDSFPYQPDQQWANPNLTVAARYMKELWLNEEMALDLGARGQKSVTGEFSFDKATEFILKRVEYHYSLRRKLIKKVKTILKYRKRVTNSIRKGISASIFFFRNN